MTAPAIRLYLVGRGTPERQRAKAIMRLVRDGTSEAEMLEAIEHHLRAMRGWPAEK